MICGIQIILLFLFTFSVRAEQRKDSIIQIEKEYKLDSSNALQKEIREDGIYTQVEKMPEYPGGEVELLTFIARNLKYPPIEDCGIQDKVIIRFVVEKTGEVSNVEVLKSLTKYCDIESVRVIKMLPKFIPGEHNGKKVAVYYKIPIVFKLE